MIRAIRAKGVSSKVVEVRAHLEALEALCLQTKRPFSPTPGTQRRQKPSCGAAGERFWIWEDTWPLRDLGEVVLEHGRIGPT